jgi:hypothetical protein
MRKSAGDSHMVITWCVVGLHTTHLADAPKSKLLQEGGKEGSSAAMPQGDPHPTF